MTRWPAVFKVLSRPEDVPIPVEAVALVGVVLPAADAAKWVVRKVQVPWTATC